MGKQGRLGFFAAVLVILGCGGREDAGPPKCITGSTSACLCADGKSGVQVCTAGGSYDACVCSVGDTGTPIDGTADSTDDVTGLPDTGADTPLTDATSPTDSVSETSPDAFDSGPAGPASCATPGEGRTTCGASGAESCCASLLVPGISSPTFSRSYDGISIGFTDAKWKAQVSSFRLDKYEVTVGRFRQYVAAVIAGYQPKAGSGKHTHLNGGFGLAGPASGYEPGWDAALNTASNFPTTKDDWDAHLLTEEPSGSARMTWTPAPSSNETRPINVVSWVDAYAFCIWDGGFLPSEAEWNYAAAGGVEQRAYPWSSAYPPGSTSVSDGYATFCGMTCNPKAVGTRSPLGDGKWGHVDLAGNVAEWVLDYFKPPYNESVCIDCAFTYAPGEYFRMTRGGGYSSDEKGILVSNRYGTTYTNRRDWSGIRCARTP